MLDIIALFIVLILFIAYRLIASAITAWILSFLLGLVGITTLFGYPLFQSIFVLCFIFSFIIKNNNSNTTSN